MENFSFCAVERTSAAQVKTFDFDNNTSEKVFHTPTLAI